MGKIVDGLQTLWNLSNRNAYKSIEISMKFVSKDLIVNISQHKSTLLYGRRQAIISNNDAKETTN